MSSVYAQFAGRPSRSAVGSSPYASVSGSGRSNTSSGARPAKFPAIKRANTGLQQPPYQHPSSYPPRQAFMNSQNPQSTQDLPPEQLEWLNSPRTQRMLQLLGVQRQQGGGGMSETQSQPTKHALPQAQGTRMFQQLQAIQADPQQAQSTHPSSQQSYSQTARPIASAYPNTSLSSTTPLAPHPPSEQKRLGGGGGYDPNAYGSSAEAKEQINPQPSQQRMFMPVSGVRRFQRHQASVRPRQAVYPLRPLDKSLQGSPRSLAQSQPPEALLTPERQMVVDYLTGPTCTLFSNNPQLNDSHLDALLDLPGLGDAPSLIRSLRSLSNIGMVFEDAEELWRGLRDTLARKKSILDWLLSNECKLFGQSPFVMFLNTAAVDRLVEESGAVRLGQVTFSSNAEEEQGQQQPPPPATQPYDDVFHVLLRLNEEPQAVHYFSELITAVRDVIEQALREAGVEVEPLAPPPQPNSPRKKQAPGAKKKNRSKASPRHNSDQQQQQQQPEEKENDSVPDQQQSQPLSPRGGAPGGVDRRNSRQHPLSPRKSSLARQTSNANRKPKPLDSLRALVLDRLSHPRCTLFQPTWVELIQEDEHGVKEEVEELVQALSKLSSVSSEQDHQETDIAALSLLQHIEDSGSVFSSVADLLEALKSGRIDGPKEASEQAANHAVLPQRKKSLKSPKGAHANEEEKTTSSNEATGAGGESDLSPQSFESKRRRLAILAHLSKSPLLHPRPSAHELYAQVFAEPVDVNTLHKIKALESHTAGNNGDESHAVFESYHAILIHLKDRSIDSPAALKAAVKEFLSSSTCLLLPQPPTKEEVEKLVEDACAGYTTLKHLRKMNAEEKEFETMDELINALYDLHEAYLEQRRLKFKPPSPVPEPVTLKVQKLQKVEIQPEGAEEQDADDEHQRKERQRRLLEQQFDESEPTESGEKDGAQHQAFIRAISSEEPQEPEQMEGEENTQEQPLTAADRRLNAQRRAVWEYVHSEHCHLLSPGYVWSVDDVENLVDDLGPGADEGPEEIVRILEQEDFRLEGDRLPAYESVTQLTERLMQQKYEMDEPEVQVQDSSASAAQALTPLEQRQRSLPATPWWNPNEPPHERHERALVRIEAARKSQEEPLERKLNDARKSGRLDARWRIGVARKKDWDLEKGLIDQEGKPQTHSEQSTPGVAGEKLISTQVPLLSALSVSPNAVTLSSAQPTQSLTIRNDEPEDVFVVLLEVHAANKDTYALKGVPQQPTYLHPGQSIVLQLSSNGGNNFPAASITFRAKAVLSSEPDHFSAQELWDLNAHRIEQVLEKAVRVNESSGPESSSAGGSGAEPLTRAQMDFGEQEPGMRVRSNRRTIAVEDVPKRSAWTPNPEILLNREEAPLAVAAEAPVKRASVPIAEPAPSATDSSESATLVPIIAPEVDDSSLTQLAQKRRQKRMTQAVDMGAVRASGMLKRAPTYEGEVAGTPIVAPTAAIATTPITVTTMSSPVAIAIADSQTNAMDATTKRRNKRMTQVTGSLAEHVKLAQASKSAVPVPVDMGGGGPGSEMTVEHVASGAPILAAANPASPVAIAKMDEQMAALTDVQKRKAKRATQAVDPLIAAALMHRVLAAKPAEAKDVISRDATFTSHVVTAPSASSPIAIAAADEETAAMSSGDRRRVRRATTITNDIPAHVRLAGASTGAPSVSDSPAGDKRSLAPSPDIPTFKNPTGALAVAVADSSVAAMSPREKKRAKRMTQALFDAAYDPVSAPEQRSKDATAAQARFEEDISATIRCAPRLATAIAPVQKKDGSISESFQRSHRLHPDRIRNERFLDKESFPPRLQYPDAPPCSYFVESLGTLVVQPSKLQLHHAGKSLPLTITNQGDFAVCVFALTSEEELVLSESESGPRFILPGQSIFLHVHSTVPRCEGEVGLVFKPLLPGEAQLVDADALWQSAPHRVMQKVHVPVVCAPLPSHAAKQHGQHLTVGTAGLSQQSSLLHPKPPQVERGLTVQNERHRRAKSRRVSGTDFVYPGSKDVVSEPASATPSSNQGTDSAPPSGQVSAIGSPIAPIKFDLSIHLTPSNPAKSEADACRRLEAGAHPSPARAERFERYRHDAEARLVNARHAQYPDYVHLVAATQQDHGPTGLSSATHAEEQHKPLSHFQSVPISQQVHLQAPPAPHPTGQSPVNLTADLESRIEARLSTITPQARQQSYRQQIRFDAEQRMMQERHAAYPSYAAPHEDEQEEQQ